MDWIELLRGASDAMRSADMGPASPSMSDIQRDTEQLVARSSRHHIEQVEKLSLICEAMWSLLREETGLSDADLMKRVTELDLRDGVLDGEYTKPPIDCPSCDSKMSRKFGRCLFCGEKIPDPDAFDAL